MKCPYCNQELKERGIRDLCLRGLTSRKKEQVENSETKLYSCWDTKCSSYGRHFIVFLDGEVWKWDKDTNHSSWINIKYIVKEKVIFT